jgi:hypothetical protein
MDMTSLLMFQYIHFTLRSITWSQSTEEVEISAQKGRIKIRKSLDVSIRNLAYPESVSYACYFGLKQNEVDGG